MTRRALWREASRWVHNKAPPTTWLRKRNNRQIALGRKGIWAVLTKGWIDGFMTNGWMTGGWRMDTWMDERMDGWMDGWIDGWKMDTWMDERMYGWMN